MTHELKSHSKHFRAVWRGEKHHEVRIFDRPFKVGDTVRLREYHPRLKTLCSRFIEAKITNITAPGTWGLPKALRVGVFSIEVLFKRPS